MKREIAVLIHTCDRYKLLFKGFNYFFQKNWNFNIPCNYYFLTENEIVDFPPFVNLHSGTGEWSDRLRKTLENLDEKYILYIQEDFWLNRPVTESFFCALFEYIEKKQIQLYKIHGCDKYITIPTTDYVDGFNIAKIDNLNSKYLMSHQISIWDREFFIKQLPLGEHPWRNERKGSKRLKKTNMVIYHSDYFSSYLL